MKFLFLSLIFSSFFLSSQGQVPNYIPTKGLVGWWPFNGNANDVSGNGNNGNVNSATLVTDRHNNANQSYYFNPNNSSSISVPFSNSLNSIQQSLTISAWIYMDGGTGAVSPPRVLELRGGYGYGGDAGFVILTNSNYNTKRTFEMKFYSDNGANNITINPTDSVSALTWHHIVFTANGNNGVAEFYLDGKLMNSDTNNTKISSCNYNNNPLIIGAENTALAYWGGGIDDLGIWNRVLTKNEIQELSKNCPLNILTEPYSQTAKINGKVEFEVKINDTTSSCNWQSNQSNLGWIDVPSNNTFYSGVTTNKLIVNNINLRNHEQLFRLIAHNNLCYDTSNVVTLTVDDTCVTSTYDTLYVKINTNSLGNFTYNTIKVYPNPISTQIIIDNGNYNDMKSFSANIVNSTGQLVFQSKIDRQQFVIDANKIGGSGIYSLYITDSLNKTISVKKIVLQ